MLKFCQRRVGAVGFYIRLQQMAPALVIEFVHGDRVYLKTFRCGYVLDAVILPESVCCSESLNA
jgi:hypothetical protein